MKRFPAEWEPQSAVLIAWPHYSGDFGKHFYAVEKTFKIIAETISHYQKLIIVCRDPVHQQLIQAQLTSLQNIFFIQAMADDIWVRDTVFLSIEEDDQPILLNFRFNGWGGKYPFVNDDALNGELLSAKPFHGSNVVDSNLILEGGSVESDGAGTIMSTRQCLLNPNRNKGLSQADIENHLLRYFGAKRILWLDQEHLAGDDTDAHIDTLARFCPDDTIAYTSCEDPHDPHYASLRNLQTQLQAFRTLNGSAYRLVALPMPKAVHNAEGQRLPANYANFLTINQAVLIPIYDDPMDQIALNNIASCFPEREILPIPCLPVIQQYGSLHCMTMQFPANSLKL